MRYYLITSTVYKRKPAFLNPEIRRCFERILLKKKDELGFRIVEYVTILEHIHLVLELKPQEDLPKIMQHIKGASSRYIFQEFPDLKMDMESNNFWTRRYYTRLLKDRRALNAAIRYVRGHLGKHGFVE